MLIYSTFPSCDETKRIISGFLTLFLFKSQGIVPMNQNNFNCYLYIEINQFVLEDVKHICNKIL